MSDKKCQIQLRRSGNKQDQYNKTFYHLMRYLHWRSSLVKMLVVLRCDHATSTFSATADDGNQPVCVSSPKVANTSWWGIISTNLCGIYIGKAHCQKCQWYCDAITPFLLALPPQMMWHRWKSAYLCLIAQGSQYKLAGHNLDQLMWYFHWQSSLAKMSVVLWCDHVTLTFLSHLRWCNRDGNEPICILSP